MRKSQLSKSQLQEKRAEAIRTGMNRAARRKARQNGVKSVEETKKDDGQKVA